MIYTTYFANLRHLPQSIVPISIAGRKPDFFKGPEYKKLAPKYGFFSRWKLTRDNDYYESCFRQQVLDELTPEQVVKELGAISGGKDVALVCYEKPSDFCHRHLVAAWLRKHGINVQEFKREDAQQ